MEVNIANYFYTFGISKEELKMERSINGNGITTSDTSNLVNSFYGIFNGVEEVLKKEII